MGLLELCEQVFGTADLYRVLGVRREASDGEVRRGYHKVSLQVHPDRVDEDQKEDATRRFQVCGPALRQPPELLPLRGTPSPVQRTADSRPGIFKHFWPHSVSGRFRVTFGCSLPVDLGKSLCDSE